MTDRFAAALDTPLADALFRTVRTFIQTFIGLFLMLTYTPGVIAAVPDRDGLQRAALAAAWGAFVAALTLVQNLLENFTNLPALLKKPVSTGQNPVPDPSGPAATPGR